MGGCLCERIRLLDLFVGGISERLLLGASVGPTFANMIALQFRNLKVADHFFYDDISQPVSFTKSQFILFNAYSANYCITTFFIV